MSQSSAANAFLRLVIRDLRLAFRRRGDLANPLLFFVIIISLFPLAIGPDPNQLQRLAPGIILVAALLATLLSLDNLFRSDFDDGSLEQLLLAPQPLPVLVAAKILAHWLVTGLPLICISPLLAIGLNFPFDALPTLLASLALGTPVLSLVGAIGVALTVGLKRGGMLLSLLVLPLYVPVLIFSASAIDAAVSGLVANAQLYILGAFLALALSLAPIAAAAALRISVD